MNVAQFDQGVDRRGSNCLKWDALEQFFGSEDLLPLWVADMDFRAPECVRDALRQLVEHGAFGYDKDDPLEKQALIGWMEKRHGIRVDPNLILFSPGVVDSLNLIIGTFACPGERVALLTPAYAPFFAAIGKAGCERFDCPLIEGENGWQMDLERLEEGFRSGVKRMILCNPHNPVGRVYTRNELSALAALAEKYNVLIVSDEIHADFEMPGHKHICMLEMYKNCVCLVSATKTFNLAALRYSSMLFGDETLKKAVSKRWNAFGMGGGNLFGAVAQKAAYLGGGEWLDELIAYVYANYRYARERFEREMPQIRVSNLEGTYLMWLDARALGVTPEQLHAFMVKRARLAFTEGGAFGDQGAGFVRMNLATPRNNIVLALDRLSQALASAEGQSL